MSSKNVIKNIASHIMYASFCVALMTISLALMGQVTINYSFQLFRPFFQMMYDNQVNIIIVSTLLMSITFNVNLWFMRHQSKTQLSSAQKYVSLTSTNTKSRLELTTLKERGMIK